MDFARLDPKERSKRLSSRYNSRLGRLKDRPPTRGTVQHKALYWKSTFKDMAEKLQDLQKPKHAKAWRDFYDTEDAIHAEELARRTKRLSSWLKRREPKAVGGRTTRRQTRRSQRRVRA